MKHKIAVDIDDVLLNFMKGLVNFYNSKYGTSFKKRDIFSYKLEESFGITKKERLRRLDEFYSSPFFSELEPIPRAQEALDFLNKENEIIIVTSREINLKKITESSLERNFKGKYSELFYSKNYSQLGGKSKAEICLEQRASVLIEDCLMYTLDCNAKGIPAFLMDKPWNKTDLKGTLVKRVRNWKEILEKINDLPN